MIFPLYTLAQSLVVLGILTSLLFFLGPIYNVVNASYRLAIVPDAFQGRVNSAVRLISFASQPLGLAATGVLLQTIGTNATVLIGGGVLILIAGAATASNHVRHVPHLARRISNPSPFASVLRGQMVECCQPARNFSPRDPKGICQAGRGEVSDEHAVELVEKQIAQQWKKRLEEE